MTETLQTAAMSVNKMAHLRRHIGRYADSAIFREISVLSIISNMTEIGISESENDYKIDSRIPLSYQAFEETMHHCSALLSW